MSSRISSKLSSRSASNGWRFDSRRSSPQTFARVVINRGIATIVESQTARCRDYRLCHRSLGAPCNSADSRSTELVEIVAEDDIHALTNCRSASFERTLLLKCDVARTVATLPPELQRICRLLMVVDRIAEVAEAAGLSRATVHRRICEIRAVFLRAGLSDYVKEGPWQYRWKRGRRANNQ